MSSSIGAIQSIPTNSEKYLSSLALLDSKLESIQGRLTKFAVTPILGTVSGFSKVLLGVVQTVSAVALSTIFLIGAIFVSDKRGALRCAAFTASHILKGVKNVVVGLFEAVPILGTQVALFQIRRMPGLLKVEARNSSKDIGNGLMMSNPELTSKHNILHRIVQGNGLCTAAYNLSINSSVNSKITAMKFVDSASMRKSITDAVVSELQACPGAVDAATCESRMKFVSALANELFDEYARLTKEEHTILIRKNVSSASDGYVYEINGSLKREYFTSSKNDETIKARFDLQINAAFYNSL